MTGNLKGSPADMAKRIDPMKLRGRAYGLGERDPKTMGAETFQENRDRTRFWSSLRKKVQANARIGRI